MVTFNVHSIFDSIQGEGLLAGVPSIFIRLAGCNLQCPNCDTDHKQREVLDRPILVRRVMNLALESTDGIRPKKITNVVLTGGEPFSQDIGPLVSELLLLGLTVQIETNGTCFHHFFPWDAAKPNGPLKIICSPKLLVHNQILDYITCFKYVVKASDTFDENGFPTKVMGQDSPVWIPEDRKKPIFFQPVDEGNLKKNRINRAFVLDHCMKYNFILSLQLHKILGIL